MTASAQLMTMPRTPATRRLLSPLATWTRRLGLHGLWITLWAVTSGLATLWSPALLDHPVFLMMLAPRAAFVVLAAPHIGFLPFVALGTARLAITDASWFIVGRRFPDRTGRPTLLSRIRWTRWTMWVTGRLCRWICSTGLVAATVLFFRPNGRYLGIAGANGVDSRLAGASSILGTMIYLVAVHVGVGTFFA